MKNGVFKKTLLFFLIQYGGLIAAQEIVLVDRFGQEHAWNPKVPITEVADKEKLEGFVVVFMNTHCPLIAKTYAPVLKALHGKYLNKIQFLAVYSNEGTTRSQMAAHKHRLDFPFPVFIDKDSLLAKHLGAKRTPEVFLLDRELKVLYRGAIDGRGWDVSGVAKQLPQDEKYLERAADTYLDGKEIVVEKTLANGCNIEFCEAKPPVEVTYYPDVDRVIKNRCTTCHYQGGIGPMPLETYEQVEAYKNTVERVVRYQRMPPLHADEERGRKLKNPKQLSEAERELIVSWVKTGAKQGDKTLAGNPLIPKKTAEFSIGGGKPEVVEMEKPFSVPANGTLDYQFFWVANASDKDRWIKEIEMLPGDSRVVHHAHLQMKSKDSRGDYLKKLSNGKWDTSKAITGARIMADFFGFSGEDANRLVAYLPGSDSNRVVFDDKLGMRVPAGMDMVFEMHYTPTGEKTQDRSKVGFVWADAAPEKEILIKGFFKPKAIEIPAHNPHHLETDEFYFKQDVTLWNVRPHMHVRGSDYLLIAEYPDGQEEILLAVPVYDFNWQHTYVFETPVKLPAGSSLKTTAHWDNSRLNPNNPNPSKITVWGEQSEDEMDNLIISYTVD